MLTMMVNAERVAGYNFQMDKKSLTKCLIALQKESLLFMHEITAVDDGVPHRVTLVCHRDIVDPECEQVRNAVQQTIGDFAAKGKIFPNGQLRTSKKKNDDKKEDTTEDDRVCNDNRDDTRDQLQPPFSFDERLSLLRRQLLQTTIQLLPDTVVAAAKSTPSTLHDSV